MNSLERKIVDILKDLRDNYHCYGLKAEFEAEGTRHDEALRLKEICLRAELTLTMKIGGAEALRDMYECRSIGIDRLVAPMVETSYALKKFLMAIPLAFPPDEAEVMEFAVNIETMAATKSFEEMLKLPEIDRLQGVVMGRVDLVGSMGLSRDHVNGDNVLEIGNALFGQAATRKLDCAVGGAVSLQSLPFLRKLHGVHKYETRKVIFRCPDALGDEADEGIMKAVGFELLWLKNKRDYYGRISREDEARIAMLESRYSQPAP